jgi:thioredoxin-related protein
MKNTTLADAGVVKLLNQKFYFVTMDIEEKRDISFHGHIFRYKPTGTNTGVHQLAEQLGTINGQLAYPALCFLNADYEITYQREGYVRPKELLAVLEKLK